MLAKGRTIRKVMERGWGKNRNKVNVMESNCSERNIVQSRSKEKHSCRGE